MLIFVNEYILCAICSRDYKIESLLKIVWGFVLNLFLFQLKIAFIFVYYKYTKIKFALFSWNNC
jgi:hypothetical protein